MGQKRGPLVNTQNTFKNNHLQLDGYHLQKKMMQPTEVFDPERHIRTINSWICLRSKKKIFSKAQDLKTHPKSKSINSTQLPKQATKILVAARHSHSPRFAQLCLRQAAKPRLVQKMGGLLLVDLLSVHCKTSKFLKIVPKG